MYEKIIRTAIVLFVPAGLALAQSTTPINAPVTDITTVTASPITIIGNNSTAKVGGVNFRT